MSAYARPWRLAALALAATLAGCATLTGIFGTRQPPPAEAASAAIIAQVCATFEPIRHSRQDVLTAETRRQIDEHNNAWDELCL